MMEVVATFQERDTVDELGVGSVRDALSDTLFPGTSVLHTRARYLLFVPWIFQKLEASPAPPKQLSRQFRNAEVKLIFALERGGEGLGVVGRDARERTQRLPAVIYWGALGRYGIRRFPGTISQYLQQISRGDRRRSVVADDGSLSEPNSRHWHAGVPAAPEGFLEESSFELRPSEADFLEERILAVAPDSFLAHLLVAGSRDLDADFPWDHPSAASAPAKVADHLEHARVFSLVMHGASLLYNLILAEEVADLRSGGGAVAIDEDLTGHYRGLVADWSEQLSGDAAALHEWDRPEFWALVASRNPRVPYHTKDFINRWADLAFERLDAVADDPDVRLLVRNRERHLKRGLARVGNARQLERWNGESGVGRLGFRWGGIKLMLDDIIDGVLRARGTTDAVS